MNRLLVAIALFLVCLHVGLSAVQQSPSPDAVAKAMVSVFKATRPLQPIDMLTMSLNKEEEDAVNGLCGRLVKKAQAVTGDSLSSQQLVQVLLTSTAWIKARRPVTEASVKVYDSRSEVINKETVDAWRAVAGSNSSTISFIALVFSDFLFDGGNWKRGNPTLATARVRGLPTEAVGRWQQTAQASRDNQSFVEWTLAGVDALFVQAQFQPGVFDQALPIAKELLSSAR